MSVKHYDEIHSESVYLTDLEPSLFVSQPAMKTDTVLVLNRLTYLNSAGRPNL